mmetsp:Transcript_20269/g.40161  ORF Transcript_20269/g.40161 Transcript_20269/m.40161 type:complete len:489 (-) Transcript_20269:68-1534(-)|eukprot:CAMPEP_0175125720 /NCGR_PEP_ID=MMETSP0087-20121206/3462_1 /TAXON_ID=136419 /ORGANISM="Unknown Unknown, Strain D1" /LENGTH=488 /DNA_ID=CAMNT_0016407567 /DNA_START=30 /DNA_END=1496 /DNA_ORIENTATION=-
MLYGASFYVGLIWLILFIPISLIFSIWFYKRREIQPIKARQPGLVLFIDFIIILFGIILGFQRIFSDKFSCMLNIWTANVGEILLLNCYCWRCWVLYFRFHLAQARINGQDDSFFVKRAEWITFPFLMRTLGSLGVLALFPCGLYLAHNLRSVASSEGDACDKGWAVYVQLSYALLFSGVFLAFSWKLRGVSDMFGIRNELKWTAIVGGVFAISWGIFSTQPEINAEFPVSTLCLFVIIAVAFSFSIVYPLYVSLKPSPSLLNADVHNLRGLLNVSAGQISFKRYLALEFSVENILFYLECEVFARECGRLNVQQKRDKEQAIYMKYIVEDAAYQVNLPASILKPLHESIGSRLRRIHRSGSTLSLDQGAAGLGLGGQGEPYSSEEAGGGSRDSRRSSKKHNNRDKNKSSSVIDPDALEACGTEAIDVNSVSTQRSVTVFQEAQDNIFRLMETDSFPRYQQTSEYAALQQKVVQEENQNTVFKDLNLA